MTIYLTTPTGGITWDFTIVEQLKVSRYGHLGSVLFKQFTPYGIELPDKFPPQRIDPRTYEMAKRIHARLTVTLK